MDVNSPEERRTREETLLDVFGEGVLCMVRACTDTEEHECLGRKAPWKERKSRYLEHLVHADARSALVTACDKRHNLGAMLADVRAQGVRYIDRCFNAGASDQVWFFEGVVKALRDRIPRRLAEELEALLADFRTLFE